MKAYFFGLAFLSVSAHADVLEARMAAYDAVMPCAAQFTGIRENQVDVSEQTGVFLGRAPAMYERCVAPRLRDRGYKAPQFSLKEFAGKWQSESLASFINEVAVRAAH